MQTTTHSWWYKQRKTWPKWKTGLLGLSGVCRHGNINTHLDDLLKMPNVLAVKTCHRHAGFDKMSFCCSKWCWRGIKHSIPRANGIQRKYKPILVVTAVLGSKRHWCLKRRLNQILTWGWRPALLAASSWLSSVTSRQRYLQPDDMDFVRCTGLTEPSEWSRQQTLAFNWNFLINLNNV